MIMVMEYSHQKPMLTLSVAAEMVKVHPRTLMIYDKLGLVKPLRTKTNRRHYSLANIEELKFIQYLTQEKGLNLTGIKFLLEAIKITKTHNFNLKKQLFPDFTLG